MLHFIQPNVRFHSIAYDLNPETRNQDNDVMHLCEEWLDKLESFIAEAESMVKVEQAKFPENP
jgi:hypothetical protein